MSIPEKLYKYQVFNKNNLTALKNSEIYFSNPSNFNDPYDCFYKHYYKKPLSEDEYKIIYNYILEETDKKEEFIQKRGTIENINQSFKKVIDNEIEKTFDALFDQVKGICCFADSNIHEKKDDNLLMWSHYANGHRGFCLEFDTSIKPFDKAQEVQYYPSIPDRKIAELLINTPEIDPLEMFKIKAKCWEYEEEWRILHSDPNQLYTYPFQALTGVYFGANMDFTHIEIISLILRGQNPDVKLYKGELHNNSYKVDFKEVNTVIP